MKSTDIIKASANSLNIYSFTAEALERLIEAVKLEHPCPTCEALARTVMLDQTSHDAQRKPLTPLEIENLRDEHLYSVQGVIQGHEAFARAIETAHGIKENT